MPNTAPLSRSIPTRYTAPVNLLLRAQGAVRGRAGALSERIASR